MHILDSIKTVVGNALNNRYSMNIEASEWESLKNANQNYDCLNAQIVVDSSQKTALRIIKRMYTQNQKEELHGFLEALSRLEPQANIIEVEVRDHVVHALNTFLLGVYLIERLDLSDEEKDSLAFQWKICGPTHDIGYTYELLLKAIKRQVVIFTELTKGISTPKLYLPEIMPRNISKLSQGFDSQMLIQQRLADWGINFNIDEYIKELRENNTPDHGMISAFLEMKYLEALYHRNNATRLCSTSEQENVFWDYSDFNKDIVSACTAVFLHNIKDINLSKNICEQHLIFNFERTPLAYILYLCDNFQEWDRYGVDKKAIDGENFSIAVTEGKIILSALHACADQILTALKSRLRGLSISLNGTDIIEDASS